MTPAAWEANFKKAQILKHGEMKCDHGSFCEPNDNESWYNLRWERILLFLSEYNCSSAGAIKLQKLIHKCKIRNVNLLNSISYASSEHVDWIWVHLLTYSAKLTEFLLCQYCEKYLKKY